MKPSAPWLFPLLFQIRPHPGAWLGSLDVRCLENYLAGCMHARRSLELPLLSPDEEARWEAFNKWCKREKLRTKEPDTRGWCLTVLTFDESDKSVRTFFAFLEEFLAMRGEKLEDFDDDGYSLGPRSFPSDD